MDRETWSRRNELGMHRGSPTGHPLMEGGS